MRKSMFWIVMSLIIVLGAGCNWAPNPGLVKGGGEIAVATATPVPVTKPDGGSGGLGVAVVEEEVATPTATATVTPPCDCTPVEPTRPTAPIQPGTTYVVHTGDTLFNIAQRAGVEVVDIMQANGLSSPYIQIYQELYIPVPGAGGGQVATGGIHIVAAGENLFRIAQRYGTTVDAITAANGLGDPSKIRVGQELVIPKKSARPVTRPGEQMQKTPEARKRGILEGIREQFPDADQTPVSIQGGGPAVIQPTPAPSGVRGIIRRVISVRLAGGKVSPPAMVLFLVTWVVYTAIISHERSSLKVDYFVVGPLGNILGAGALTWILLSLGWLRLGGPGGGQFNWLAFGLIVATPFAVASVIDRWATGPKVDYPAGLVGILVFTAALFWEAASLGLVTWTGPLS